MFFIEGMRSRTSRVEVGDDGGQDGNSIPATDAVDEEVDEDLQVTGDRIVKPLHEVPRPACPVS